MPHSSSPPNELAILGGTPACDVTWPTWPIHDEQEEQALLKVLRSGKWWFGERVRQFEREFADFQGAKHAVSCTNGTTAIEMALRGIGVVEGDEVIVPAYSFIATASAVVTVGAIPVFADILPDTLCIDPADVRRKLTKRTRCILPVHVSGLIADMASLQAIADEHSLVVMEDAAHAWGSESAGQGAGTLSRCGTFSFQETKNITAGEGGILVTNDAELAELCRSYTHCGRTSGSAWYDHDVLGSNLRLTEFQAAILLAQLGRLPSQVTTRARNAAIIDQRLSELSGVQVLSPMPSMTRRSYHMYIFRVNPTTLGATRTLFIEAVRAEGVPVSAGWYRPLYQNGVFKKAHVGPAHGVRSPLAAKGVDYTNVSCPVCEEVCEDAVWIPQNVLLADEPAIHKLIDAVEKVVLYARREGLGTDHS